jgi:hypothetical protein
LANSSTRPSTLPKTNDHAAESNWQSAATVQPSKTGFPVKKYKNTKVDCICFFFFPVNRRFHQGRSNKNRRKPNQQTEQQNGPTTAKPNRQLKIAAKHNNQPTTAEPNSRVLLPTTETNLSKM